MLWDDNKPLFVYRSTKMFIGDDKQLEKPTFTREIVMKFNLDKCVKSAVKKRTLMNYTNTSFFRVAFTKVSK